MRSPRILVVTATLGNRETLAKTIASVKSIGGDDVKHIIVCPEKSISAIQDKFPDIECLAERTDKRGIYAALNHGFQTYGHDYEYMTFINDDDHWLPAYRKLIDIMFSDSSLDMVYGRTCYVDDNFVKIGEQTSSPQLHQFTALLKRNIVLLTQQATLIKSSLYFRVGGFDESYKLVADTKFWANVSLLPDLKFRYIKDVCAAYMIQANQLSSDHTTQSIEHKRVFEEMKLTPSKKDFFSMLKYRMYNFPIYIKRLFMSRKVHNPFMGGVRAVKNAFVIAARCIIVILPWRIKRCILQRCYGYELDKRARIGFAYVYPKHLKMAAGSKISHFTTAIHLDNMLLGENVSIGRSNWITGFPIGTSSKHFSHDASRRSELIIGRESAITKHHHIDCTNTVKIGEFVTIAGYDSQILTHSINIYDGRQDSKPVMICDYCFVSSGVKILGGSKLPDHSVLAAGAVLNKEYEKSFCLYGGVPARNIKEIPSGAKYMCRDKGYVW